MNRVKPVNQERHRIYAGEYLGERAGDLAVEIEQGVEVGRPSFISVQAYPGRARVGGEVRLASEGSLF